ncbi:MAG: helix-turn-helix transcriptional regulator [Firmicutes bacterium]|nr:helix-turn-helix transcriptional regulator [Bacillota bacterium]
MEEILRIRELREEKGLTQGQLAKAIGVHRATIGHYEIGYTEPDIKTIKKLCKFFDVTSDYLLGLTEY